MKKINFKNIGVDIVDSSSDIALEEVGRLIELKKKAYVCFLEGNLFSQALSNNELQDVLRKADLVFPDGVILSILNRIKGRGKLQRISGPSFMLKACEYGQQFGWKHFFYGGDEGVPGQLVKKLTEKYPDVKVAGMHSPPFRGLTDNERLNVKQMIEDSGADLLWVGLGGPKQEFWMAKHVNKIDVPVMLGVGAAFDFHSGNRLWAPEIVRMVGLEWLFRTVTGGIKTFRRNMVCQAKITLLLSKEFLRACLKSRSR